MQKLWKNRLVTAGWIALGVLCVVVLVAAGNKKSAEVCAGVEVEISGTNDQFFVDEKEVIELIEGTGKLKGKKLEAINLQVLENRLKSNIWISNADLFFDNNNVLNVKVEENEPVARIFTIGGSSFYIDSACKKLPLSDKMTARVPMVTGFPANVQKLSGPDSALLASVKNLAMVINSDEFWKAQVAQVDITPNGFEIVPTIGNHVVALGQGADYKEKLDKTFSFYKQVWVKTGLEKYDRIDVQYKGQVVATKKGFGVLPVDSVKAKAAWEKLVSEVKKVNEDNKFIVPETGKSVSVDTVSIHSEEGLKAEMPANKMIEKNETVHKPINEKSKENKAEKTPLKESRVPKAIMGKPNQNKNN